MSRLIKVKLVLVDGTHLIANRSGIADSSGQWENKLIGEISFKRNVTLDRMFERGGITITIDDANKAYQTIFASDTNRKIYGKAVTIYIYKRNGVTLMDTITATIQGWKRESNNVIFECVQEFAGAMGAIPPALALVINNTDFPDAWGQALGKPVLFPTGICDSRWGAIEIWKVINRNVGLGIDAKYLITKSAPLGAVRITTLNDVFENGTKIPGAHYDLVVDANGWEYVNYNGTAQRIRINVVAVSNPGTAGSNPVVALRGILTAAGVTLIDDGDGGTDDFEQYCTTALWTMGGVPEGTITTKDYLESWCQNFNCFWRQDSTGAVHIKHINWATIASTIIMTENHFKDFNEVPDMNDFANRVRSKSGPGNATWVNEIITDSTTGDYLPATFTKEMTEEYLLAAFGGATPFVEKLRFYDRVKQIATGNIDLWQYEILGSALLTVADVTHSRQLGGAGKYLVISENIDLINENVQIEMLRLWGI